MGESRGARVVLSAGAATDVGLRRSKNEDSLLAAFPVFVVADGMGGHDVGERASQAVVAELEPLVGRRDLTATDVASALDRAHTVVRRIADAQPNGAGSTVTGAVVVEQAGRAHWLVFNIGDSRVYRVRDGELEQLTVDHSMAQELIEQGQLAKSDVATFAQRNVITKAMGADDSAADFWVYPIVEGDSLVVCSDGLTGEISDAAIGEVVHSGVDAQAKADRLVHAALAAGGRDNISVVVVEVVAGGISASLDEATRMVRPSSESDDDDDDDGTTVEMPRRVPRG
ncbi:protein phosphatase 2C domain-containing protein [soil metagenome]